MSLHDVIHVHKLSAFIHVSFSVFKPSSCIVFLITCVIVESYEMWVVSYTIPLEIRSVGQFNY